MRPWDEGVRWHLEQVEAPTAYPLDVDFVRDDHLRGANGTAEDDYISRLIRVATRSAERYTKRPLMPQTWALVMSRFPCWQIEVPKPPLLSVESIEYVDDDGAAQTLGSPAIYQVSAPHGPQARRGIIAPLYEQEWPTTQPQTIEAVTVTFRCGYVRAGSPAVADVPEDITQGMLLLIGEMYKHRSESVIGPQVAPAVLRAKQIWHDYRVY